MPNCSENRSYDRPQRIHHAPGQRRAHGHGGNLPRAAHQIAFADAGGIAHDGHADALFFEVEHDAAHALRELHQLAGHGILQAENARNAIAHAEHRAAFKHLGGAIKVFNLPLRMADISAGLSSTVMTICSFNLPSTDGVAAASGRPHYNHALRRQCRR